MNLHDDLVVLDTETTGLTLEHDVWEVAFAVGEGPVESFIVHHSLRNADKNALLINGYLTRFPFGAVTNDWFVDLEIQRNLEGKTIIGANPSFDAYRLERRWGRAPWHYRLVDVESMAIPILGLDKPLGLKGLVDKLGSMGYTLPENDHTAAGDVAATREVYRTLCDIGSRMRGM